MPLICRSPKSCCGRSGCWPRPKPRLVPLWQSTAAAVRAWLHANPELRGSAALNYHWAPEVVHPWDADDVDPIVGMYAEDLIPGQGFSDTATRIFLLMAARRVNSDRFLTTDMRPEVYTQVGYDWVQKTTMTDILLRHYPELAPALSGVENPFGPWNAMR